MGRASKSGAIVLAPPMSRQWNRRFLAVGPVRELRLRELGCVGHRRADRGVVGAAAGDVPDDLHGLVFGKFLLFEEFAAAGGEAVEQRLGDVGQDGGVAAGDEAAGGHAQEVSEELVDGGGGGEVLDLGEKLGGESFGILGLARLLGMMRTEGRVALGAREAATAT